MRQRQQGKTKLVKEIRNNVIFFLAGQLLDVSMCFYADSNYWMQSYKENETTYRIMSEIS